MGKKTVIPADCAIQLFPLTIKRNFSVYIYDKLCTFMHRAAYKCFAASTSKLLLTHLHFTVSRDLRAPVIWDKFVFFFITNCTTLMVTEICADPRTGRGFSWE